MIGQSRETDNIGHTGRRQSKSEKKTTQHNTENSKHRPDQKNRL